MRIGIVGSEEAKFTALGRERAIDLISELIADPQVTEVCSGECHLGGIDIWAKQRCFAQGKLFTPFPPERLTWEFYKKRNLQIAEYDVVHCITVDKLPNSFKGMRFDYCYHCKTDTHVKSGGCWTMKKAKVGILHVIQNS